MLDAEMPEGDLSQVILAIQNALKPPAPTIQQRLSTQAPPALSSHVQNGELDFGREAVDSVDETQLEPATSRPSRETRSRKPVALKVLPLDINCGVSFDSFANQHNPKTNPDRNLVVLAWFKEHRPQEEVTADHIYTCSRSIKGQVGIEDFARPLRSLKKEQFVTSPSRGIYVISHLGIARVEKMSVAA